MEEELFRFAFAVQVMRDRQKEYFRTRDRHDLIQSKQEEKTIDRWIQEVLSRNEHQGERNTK